MTEQELSTFLAHLDKVANQRNVGARHKLLSVYAGGCVLPALGVHPWNVSVLAWQRIWPGSEPQPAYSLILRNCVPFDNGGLLIGSVTTDLAEHVLRGEKECLLVPGALPEHAAYISLVDDSLQVQLGGVVLEGMMQPWTLK